MASLGFGTSDSKGTQRSGTEVSFPKQFMLDYNTMLGGPFTTGDLFRLAPRKKSLFGGDEAGPQREGGGFNLGYGLPPAGIGAAGPTVPPTTTGPITPPGQTPAPVAPTDGTAPAATPPAQGTIYGINDILPAWENDPEKVMDIGRFFRQSGLNPDGFTREDYASAIQNLGQYGFSGRSSGNFNKALSLLRSDSKLSGALGGISGGRGSGVFNG